MAKKLTTNAEVAKHLDITPEYVSKLKRMGILEGGRGKQSMDLDRARFSYINFLRTKARMTPKGDADSSITEEKMRLTKAQADKAEIEVNVLNEQMLRSEEVIKGWSVFVGNIRGALLNLPSKISHQVIGLETYAQAEELITNEVYEILDELSEQEYDESNELGLEANKQTVQATAKA